MSAECGKCGSDLVYGEVYPDMFCERCELKDDLISVRNMADELRHRLIEAEHEVSRLRECRDTWKAQAESLAATHLEETP